MTRVYSDSDAGKKQELTVGTSPLQFGRVDTLSMEPRPKPGEAIIPD